MIWTPSQDFKDARLVGGLQGFLNAVGSDKARLNIYDGTMPVGGATPSGTLLVSIRLASPAFDSDLHILKIEQFDPVNGDIIAATGDAAFARLLNPAGVWAGDGDVTAASGSGMFKLAGTVGTTLLLGGKAFITSGAFT